MVCLEALRLLDVWWLLELLRYEICWRVQYERRIERSE